MDFKVIASSARDIAARTGMKIADKSYIFFGIGGIAAITYGTYKAVKTGPEAHRILDNHKARMDEVVQCVELGAQHKLDYTRKNKIKDTAIIYAQTTADLAKLFAPSIFMYGLGVLSICQSHRILTKRNAALAASYAALKKSYDDYREQVATKYGEEYDTRTANHIGNEHVNIADENGEIKEHKAKNVILDSHGLAPYTVLIDEHTSTEFTPNGITNMSQAEAVRAYWQERFEHRKFVEWPEVLKNLGCWDRLPDEQQAMFIGKGWVWNPEDPSTQTIKFTYYDCLFNKYPEIGGGEPIRMVEPALLLEANVQGDVAYLFREIYSRRKVCARRRAAKAKVAEDDTVVAEA